MDAAIEFIIDTPDEEVELSSTGPAADYLLHNGFANADREPHWHLRWCLDRMEAGEAMMVGDAQVIRLGRLRS